LVIEEIGYKMMNWRVSKDIEDYPEGFPFAITSGKVVVAWVKNERDADDMVAAPSKISRLTTESARNRTMWLSCMARKR
jgi:hypothetical protein